MFSLTGERHRECVRDKIKMNVTHRVLCGDYRGYDSVIIIIIIIEQFLVSCFF